MTHYEAQRELEEMKRLGRIEYYALSFRAANYGDGAVWAWNLGLCVNGKWNATTHATAGEAIEQARKDGKPPTVTRVALGDGLAEITLREQTRNEQELAMDSERWDTANDA